MRSTRCTSKTPIPAKATRKWPKVLPGSLSAKAAFGLEVSKNFGVAHRAYYHLRMVESFLDRTGVEFERDFPLTPEGITRALGSDVYVGFVNNRVVLPLDNARPMQAGSLPLPRGAENAISSSMPIVAVTTGKNVLQVHYGNNTVTSFRPDWLLRDLVRIFHPQLKISGEQRYYKRLGS